MLNPLAPTGHDPLSTFRAQVADDVVALDVHTEHPERFHGGLHATATGDAHIISIRASDHAVHRTTSLITRSPRPYVKFSLVEKGSGLLVQGGRETILGPGDMAFYDTDRPYSLLFDRDVAMSVVMFPKEMLAIPSHQLARVTAVRLDGNSGVGSLVRPYVSSLAGQVREVDTHVARRLVHTAIGMVGALLEGSIRDAQAAPAEDPVVASALEYIDDHLSDPELCPAQIAAAHFVSVRTLYALFQHQGNTVARIIRHRRLERCYDDLVDPRLSFRSVATIAVDNGFVDAAHFNRTFRAHYGVTPGSIRRGAEGKEAAPGVVDTSSGRGPAPISY